MEAVPPGLVYRVDLERDSKVLIRFTSVRHASAFLQVDSRVINNALNNGTPYRGSYFRHTVPDNQQTDVEFLGEISELFSDR